MNRKIKLAKKKRTQKAQEQALALEQTKAQVELKTAIDRLYELMNGQEAYDFDKLHKQLVEIDKRLDLAPLFKSLEKSIKGTSHNPLKHKTKIDGFSELLQAVKTNKPLPSNIKLDKLEKAVVNIERYIKDSTEESDQGAEKYKPVRRVVKVGNRFLFDDNITSPGGGGGIDTSGLATSAKQDTQQTSLDSIKTAVETIDNAISGSEMQVDVVGSLPAGTNAIGKLAANSGVDIGDVDVTSSVTSSLDHGSNLDIDTSAEQITSTSFSAKFGVTVKADITNTGIVYIGNSDVTAGSTEATDGFPLSAGETLTLEVNNPNLLYAIGSANNQKVYWVAN